MNTKVWIVIFVLLASIASADPFLISDPQTDANKFRLRLSADNGATWGVWVEGNPVSNAAKFSLLSTPTGTYKGELEAGAMISVTDTTSGVTTTAQQWSAAAPFSLSVKLPVVPKNTRVVDGN